MQRVRNLTKPSAAAKAVAEGRPAPSCAVVSDSEVQKMYELVEGAGVRAAADDATQRKQLKAISDARVANWPNTIEAQRLRKERTRKERFDAEEERRKVIDEQEAELRAAKREQAIRNADMLLFEQNDRVKTFSSKLFLATVLEEREKQLQFSVERAAIAKQHEAVIAQQQAEELRRAEQEEAQKISSIQRRMFELKKSQLEQLADIRKSKIAARDEDRAEGQMIKERAAAAVDEEIRLEAERVVKQKARDRELVTINESHKALKAERIRQEQEEEKKILEFAALKEVQTLERKKRVDERKSSKLATRQQLIDRQAQLLEEIQQATEEREMRAMRDFERERREREEREEAARQKRQKEIDDFRADYKERKAEREATESSERKRMKEVWAVRAERLIDEELEERQERRNQSERLQHIHLLQWQEKQLQEAHDKRKLFEEGIHMQNALKQEQEQYEKYVSSVMNDYVTKGRNSDLVQLAVRRARRVNTAS